MAEIVFRQEADHGVLTALYRSAGLEIGEGWEMACHPVFSVSARRDEALLGAATVSRRFDRLVLDYIALLPEVRARGLGRRLTERCVRFAGAAGERSLWIAARNPGFFLAVGAEETEDTALLADCLVCPARPNCEPKELVIHW